MTQDGEIRVRSGAATIQIPVVYLPNLAEAGAPAAPPRVAKVGQGSNVRHCGLVQTTDGHATAVRVQTTDGIYALADTDWDTLSVTLAGLAGDFAVWNGVNVITFGVLPLQPNFWFLASNGDNVRLFYFAATPEFRVIVRGNGDSHCEKTWNKTTDVHTPCGTYSEYACTATGCADGNSCTNSAGATCVVTISP